MFFYRQRRVDIIIRFQKMQRSQSVNIAFTVITENRLLLRKKFLLLRPLKALLRLHEAFRKMDCSTNIIGSNVTFLVRNQANLYETR